MIWVISVVCLSWVCEPIPPFQGAFATKAACEKAMKEVYFPWVPNGGAYVFKCVAQHPA